MTHVVFVVPFRFETSERFLRAALALPGLRVSLVGADPLERFDADVQGRLAGHWQVRDPLDAQALVAAVRGLERQLGAPVERLVGVLEQLQVPLAEARAELGLPGLDVEAAHNFRDKARMKDALRAAGLPCARHHLATNADEARAFLKQIGPPLVVKPPAGAGAVDTLRVDNAAALEDVLAGWPLSPARPMLLEEFIVGEEHSYDAVAVGGKVVWYSISRYLPAPLEVLREDWIQWCVVLPRDVSGPEYDAIREVAPRALEVLGLDTGLAHMEWFRRPDGSVAISEVGARPPGAQFTSLMSAAHDTDMYVGWCRLVLGLGFDPPERRYAAGGVYLRGQGRGRVKAVHGLQLAQRDVGSLVVEVRLPATGKPRSSTYEGDGYVLLRHPETEVVLDACRRILQVVKVELG